MAVLLPSVVFVLFLLNSRSESSITITRGPQPSNYIEGVAIAYMFCLFDNVGDNQIYFWEKGGEKITDDGRKYSTDIDKPTGKFDLEIKQIERSDDAEYVCAVTENGQTDRSEPAKLTVKEIPSDRYPHIEQEEQYIVGESATISCVSEETNPRPELKLFRSDSNKPLEVYDENTDNADTMMISYLFTPTMNDTTAIFSCKLTSPKVKQDFVRFKNVSINVQFPPIISIKHEKVMEAGKVAILICETDAANPEAMSYEWHDKKGVGFDDNFIIKGNIMRIENPTMYLNGTVLICSVENSIGKTEKEVTLFVTNRGTTGSDINESISAVLNPAQSNTEQKSMDILLKTVIIAGIITISIITLLVLPLCLHHVCVNRHAIDAMGRKISQPQIYFEAHDRVLPTPPENMENYTWKRSLAVQVPDDLEIDIELVYQEISEKSRSNRNTLAKTTSTYS